MRIWLDKVLITKLYFYLLQAERSIDKVLGNPWSDFLAYYGPEKVTAIEEIIHCLGDLLHQQGIGSFSFNREEITRKAPVLGMLKYFFGRYIARWKRAWSFPARELCYMATSLDAVLRLLRVQSKPDLKLLVHRRMDLCSCRSLIEVRCHGLPVLDYGMRIEHLYQSNWIAPASLADILEGKTDPSQYRRKSA